MHNPSLMEADVFILCTVFGLYQILCVFHASVTVSNLNVLKTDTIANQRSPFYCTNLILFLLRMVFVLDNTRWRSVFGVIFCGSRLEALKYATIFNSDQ